MTQDVRQWLAEIKSLQQKLTEAQQEREDALKSATNWRNLYETEARQRRTEAKLTQQKVAAMQRELDALKAPPSLGSSAEFPEADTADTQTLQQQLSQLDDAELQTRLIAALQEHDRLQQALRSEQTAHQQTRVELTAALGDAIERLTQERARSQNGSKPEESPSPEQSAVLPPAKNAAKSPSLELPQFD